MISVLKVWLFLDVPFLTNAFPEESCASAISFSFTLKPETFSPTNVMPIRKINATAHKHQKNLVAKIDYCASTRAGKRKKILSLIEKPRMLPETPSKHLMNTLSDGVQLEIVPGKMVFGPKIDSGLRSNITQAQFDFLQKNVSVVKICLKDTHPAIVRSCCARLGLSWRSGE